MRAEIEKRSLQDSIEVRSAGIAAFAGSPASIETRQILLGHEIDFEGFRSTQASKYLLDESEMPTQWYNLIPDLPAPPPPPLHPGTGQPIGPEDLAPLFPMALILQEVSGDSYIDIPEEVQRPVASVAQP